MKRIKVKGVTTWWAEVEVGTMRVCQQTSEHAIDSECVEAEGVELIRLQCASLSTSSKGSGEVGLASETIRLMLTLPAQPLILVRPQEGWGQGSGGGRRCASGRNRAVARSRLFPSTAGRRWPGGLLEGQGHGRSFTADPGPAGRRHSHRLCASPEPQGPASTPA